MADQQDPPATRPGNDAGAAVPGASRVTPPPMRLATKGWWRRPEATVTLEELEREDRDQP